MKHNFTKIALIANFVFVSSCMQVPEVPSPQVTNNIDLKTQTLDWGISHSTKPEDCANYDFAAHVGKVINIEIGFDITLNQYMLRWGVLEKDANCSDPTSWDCYGPSAISNVGENQIKIDESTITTLEAMLNGIPEADHDLLDCPVKHCTSEDAFTPISDGFHYTEGCTVGGTEYAQKVNETFRYIKSLVPNNI